MFRGVILLIDFSFVLGIEDLVVRVVIVGVILTFRSLTQEALEMVCGLLLRTAEILFFRLSHITGSCYFPYSLERETKISEKALNDPAKKIKRDAR